MSTEIMTEVDSIKTATRLAVDGWVQLPSGQCINLDAYDQISELHLDSYDKERGSWLKLGVTAHYVALWVYDDDAIALLNYLGAAIPSVED